MQEPIIMRIASEGKQRLVKASRTLFSYLLHLKHLFNGSYLAFPSSNTILTADIRGTLEGISFSS